MLTAVSRRQVAVAVAVVAALTVAPLAAGPSAVAASAAVTAAPAAVPFLASGGQVLGAGKSGFLTRDADGFSWWTRYTDGVSKKVVATRGADVRGSASDVVVDLKSWAPAEDRYGTASATLYSMAPGGGAPVTIGGFGSDALAVADRIALAVAGDKLVVVAETVGRRKVTGVPVDRAADGSYDLFNYFSVADSVRGAAAVVRRTGDRSAKDVMVVDLAGARVSQAYRVPADVSVSGVSITGDRVVWVERTGTGAAARSVFASVPRGSAVVTRVPLANGTTAPDGGLLGDWILSYGAAGPKGGLQAVRPAGGAPVSLLAYAESVQRSADGTVLALGTTADRGTGVYRLAVGADGKPAAELIAATGQPPAPTTPLSYVGTSVPATLRLDGVAKTRLSWKFSTTRADLAISAVRKGSTWDFRTIGFTQVVRPRTTGTGVYADGSLGFDWAGEIWGDDRPRAAAPAGTYEVTVTARPWNGMPAVTVTRLVEVKRTPQTHDFSDRDNGSPDILARRANGAVDAFDTRWDDASRRLVRVEKRKGAIWWRDWNEYDRVEVAGNIAGQSVPDVIARDKSGVLWLHKDNHGGYSSARVKISAGWAGYTRFAAGSDLTGDKRADLVAVDKLGDLYLFKGTGVAAAPFAARKKIGHGWGVYQDVVAVGNVGGAAAGDVVGRDKDGVLWLHLGKGDGTFAPRTRIGGGWNAYADLVGIDDADKDGRPDLYARTKTGEAYFYAGTGNWKAPFKVRSVTEAGAGKDASGIVYNQAF
ncbi:FG-GAP repeat domain-containing protein [Streptomyces sp. NPDC056144]|uniref:FG-GAP repeat domain-containing protein n=1 Tax=unclassified Streptomyces TaxID=2593676 RepID=UPI0035E38F74